MAKRGFRVRTTKTTELKQPGTTEAGGSEAVSSPTTGVGVDSSPQTTTVSTTSSTGQTEYDDQASPDALREKKAKQKDDVDLADAENGASTDGGQKTDQTKEEKKSKIREFGGKEFRKKIRKDSRFSRRQKVGIGLTSAGVGLAGFFGLGFFSGPLALLQFSQSLQGAHFFNNENFGDNRTSRLTTLYRYANTGTVQGTRLGTITGRHADKWDQRLADTSGVRLLYDNDTGVMVGLEVLDERKAQGVIRELERNGYDTNWQADNVNAGRFGDTNITGRTISARNLNDSGRRSIIKIMVRSTGFSKKSSGTGTFVLNRLGGVNRKPMKGLVRRAGEVKSDYDRRKQAERSEIIKNGADGTNPNNPRAGTTVDGDGNEVIDPASQDAANGAATEIDDAADARNNGTLGDYKTRFGLKLASGAAAAVGVLCVVKGLGETAEQVQFANTILPMMRIGFEMVALGEQIKSGVDVVFDELGYYASLLYDHIAQVGVAGAATSQFEAGQPPTGPDIESGVKPDGVTNVPLLFTILNNPALGLGIACGLDGLLSKIPIIGNIANAVSALQTGAINAVLQTTFNTNLENLTASVVNWLAGEAVNNAATGAQLANYAHYGTRLAANAFALAFGGRILTGTETNYLDEYKQEVIAYENSQKSVFDRYFDVYDNNSFASKAIQQAPAVSPQGFVASLLQAPLSMLNVFSPKVSAQPAVAYDYGFPEVGWSLDELENPNIADPFANAAIVEPQLDDLTSRYGGCFPARVSVVNGEAVLSVESFTNPDMVTQFNIDRDVCASTTDLDLLRYRAYLGDISTAKALDCYEGTAAACEELGQNSPLGGAFDGGSGNLEGDLGFTSTIDYAIYSTFGDPVRTDNRQKDGRNLTQLGFGAHESILKDWNTAWDFYQGARFGDSPQNRINGGNPRPWVNSWFQLAESASMSAERNARLQMTQHEMWFLQGTNFETATWSRQIVDGGEGSYAQEKPRAAWWDERFASAGPAGENGTNQARDDGGGLYSYDLSPINTPPNEQYDTLHGWWDKHFPRQLMPNNTLAVWYRAQGRLINNDDAPDVNLNDTDFYMSLCGDYWETASDNNSGNILPALCQPRMIKVTDEWKWFHGYTSHPDSLTPDRIRANPPPFLTDGLGVAGLNGYTIPCRGMPTPVVRINTPGSDHSDWSNLRDSGVIGTNSSGDPIRVFVRDACDTSNPRTVLIVSSIHGSENGGQLIGHELLYNRQLPSDVRVIVVPEVNKTGIEDRDAGCVFRDANPAVPGGYTNCGRVNANAVNLNRNSDYRWNDMNRIENTSTSGEHAGNYRGRSPNSEPETQAIQSFIQSLGDINLTLHYHDNLNYVGSAVDSAGLNFASEYSSLTGLPLGNRFGSIINQRGSLDGWQASRVNTPVVLVEMGDSLSTSIINNHADAIVQILNGGIVQ